jgi:hypothetical protein
MTFPIDTGRDCARAWEAMPWVLQDLAPQEQGEWLMHHLAGCEACQAEYAQQQRLRAALALPAEPSPDPEVGLKRLLARLDEPEVSAVPAPARREASGWLTRALVAAVLVQALGLGALGLKYWSAGDGAGYRTYSQEAAPVPVGSIHVVPETTMKVSDWNTLLREQHLRVIGGPNDVGAYTVQPTGEETAQQAVQHLRATRGIRFAEPVAGTP